MPQLLHFLKVDQQTSLAAPVPRDPTAMDVPQEGEEGHQTEQPPPPPAAPEGGRHFVNKSQRVRRPMGFTVNHADLPILFSANVVLQDIDWGALDVFTCSASCDVVPVSGDGGAYVEELVLVQPPVYKD